MLNVVIADDDLNARKGLQTVIKWEELGANLAFVARNGQEVVEYLKAHPVDLLISDIKMPLLDGVNLSRYVREHYPFVIVILLSAYAEFELCQKALRYGVREYLLKPIDRLKVQKLCSLIGEVAEEKKRGSELNKTVQDANFKSDVENALQNKDFEFLEKVVNLSDDYKKTDIAAIKKYYLLLLNIALEFCAGGTKELYLQERIWRVFAQLNDVCEFREFVSKCFHRILIDEDIDLPEQKHDIAEKVKEYVDENYLNKDLTVSAISMHFGFSATYLGILFKESQHLTLNEYILCKRMGKACRLLKTTSISISNIGKMVGYGDTRYFSRTFKKYVGVTPTQYRLGQA